MSRRASPPLSSTALLSNRRIAARTARLTLVAALGLVVGCGLSNQPGESPAYLPSWPEAKDALASALDAWQKSASPMPASFDTPTVRFVDKQRRPGQPLERFEILNRVDVQGARQFAVRLHLKGEESPQLVRYNVLGKAPVWVFRLDDLDMFSHWEHDMNSEPAPTPTPGRNTQSQPAGPSRETTIAP